MNYKTINVPDLAQVTIDVGIKCKLYGVSRIAISSILTRSSAQLSQVIGKVNDLLKSLCVTNYFYYISNEMIDHRMLWKDGIHLTDDGNVLNYLNINLENVINFNVDFHNSENDMLDLQQTSKVKSLSVDTNIEEVGPRSSKNLDNKVPKKIILGAYKNSLKATDCLSLLKKTRIENINNFILGNLNINSFPKKFDDIKALVTGMLDILIVTETNWVTHFQFLSSILTAILNLTNEIGIEIGVV